MGRASYFCKFDRQRGSWVSGAAWHTDPGCVPTEPSIYVVLPCMSPFYGELGRRGGWASGAIWHTEPGHVPTEPFLDCSSDQGTEVRAFVFPHFSDTPFLGPSFSRAYCNCDDCGIDVGRAGYFCKFDRQRGSWVSGAAWHTDPGCVPTEPSIYVVLQCKSPLYGELGRRGGWASGAIWHTDPGHVPTEPFLDCSSDQGTEVRAFVFPHFSGTAFLGPSFSRALCNCDNCGIDVGRAGYFCKFDRQRGSWVSGAAWHTDPGCVPTEPSIYVLLQCKSPLYGELGRRGGWASGAIWHTEPGHVPTEPFLDCSSDQGTEVRAYVFPHFGDLTFLGGAACTSDCFEPRLRFCRLTVRVRQLSWSSGLCNHCGCSLLFAVQALYVYDVFACACYMDVWQGGVVFPACWCGGLLNTQRGLFSIQFVKGHYSALGVSICGGTDIFDFTWMLALEAPLWSAVPRWLECLDINDCGLLLFEDSAPLQLAGLCSFCSDLQRQIRLLVVRVFFNVFALISGILKSGDVKECGQSFPDFCAPALLVPLLGPMWRTSPELAAVPSGVSWVHQLRVVLEQLSEKCVWRLGTFLQALLSTLGFGALAFFRTGCLIVFSYLGRLLFFGLQLKGGRCNCDNLLRTMRYAAEPVPWAFGAGLCEFSPRLHRRPAPTGKACRLPLAYTTELFFFLVLLSAILQPVAAANYKQPPPHPTEFPRPPAYQDTGYVERGLLGDGNVAQDLHPHIGAAQPPPEVFVTRAYKLLGFGRQPEYVSCTTARTATAQRCLELLEPDVEVSRTGGRGALHFLKGPSVTDELHAQWIPDWVRSALGRVVVVDASLLGYTPFQAHIQDGIASYNRIHQLIPELEGQEFYIFIPAQGGDPLAFEGYQSRMIIDHGDVIHLTPDPAPPQAMLDIQWSFDYFSEWSLTEFADGYDAPSGVTRVLVLSAGESFLIDAVEGESDDALTRRICGELEIPFDGSSVVRPREPFERPMYNQHYLTDIVYFLDAPLVATELVVFIDARPVLQTFSAVHLQGPVIPVASAVDVLGIRVEAVEGYRLWLQGGMKRQGHLVAEHGDIFSLRLEAQDSDSSSAYSSDDSSLGSDSEGDSEPGQDFSATPGDGARAGLSVEDVVTQPSAAGPPGTLGDNDSASTHTLHAWKQESVQRGAAMWNRAYSREAFGEGRLEDTSSSSSFHSSLRTSPTLGRRRPSSNSISVVPNAGAWLFAVTLAAQVRTLLAVGGVEHALGFQVADVGRQAFPDCTFPGGAFPSCPAAPGGTDAPARLHVGVLVTLLEDAKDEGFLLVCQFVSEIWTGYEGGKSSHAAPVPLSLEHAIPCTGFQQDVLALQALLPDWTPVEFHSWQDWLDCDLHFVHKECKACSAVWDWLTSFPSWYDGPFCPEAVHIYTDGSACSTGVGRNAPASWAFNVWALTATRQAFLGHASGVAVQARSPFFLGELDQEALTGEQLALAWALSWTIEASCAFRKAVFVFYFDSLTAGCGGFGDFRMPADRQTSQPSGLSRSVTILRQCAQIVCPVVGKHVPSHSGFAGNELADILAKFAGRHPVPDEAAVRPTWPSLITQHRLADWAWLAMRSQVDLPALGAFEAEASRLFQAEASRPFSFFAEPKSHSADGHSLGDLVGVRLHLCTLNALSLREQDAVPQGLAVVGKRALLKQQLIDHQLHVVALQETRTPGDCVQPDADFVMLHSSCDQYGCFGCALWLSKALPVIVAGCCVSTFTKEACTVLLAEPRVLIVQVDLPNFPVTFVSAHAPYEGHKSQEAARFWQKVGGVVASRPSGAQLVVLADSNGHLGSIGSTAVGVAGAECENGAGTAFHDFLISYGLSLPSTFPDSHRGGHCTWRVSSGAGHRLDYIAVPEDWFTGTLASSVWYDFDHVHDVDDHQPVLLFCELARNTSCVAVKHTARALRPQPDTDPGQLQCFCYAVEALPAVDWQFDVDTHYATFVRSTAWCWSEFVQSVPHRRCKPFVSEDTLLTLAHRKEVRRFLASESAALNRVRVLTGFFAFWMQWQHTTPTARQTQHLQELYRRGRFCIASAVGCLGKLRTTLRKAIGRDRAKYLSQLAGTVAESSLQQPKQLFAAVYKAFPVVRSKRRGGFCPLPAVLLESGGKARNLEERMQRWTEHFASQEGGRIVAEEAYDHEVRLQAPHPANVPAFDIRCVPTLTDIEQDILQLRRGKAAGPDMITADILKLDVPTNSRRLLPIFVKAALACREPIIFKGGCLITLAKKAYASLNCADFRSIILSSVPGKLLHRSLRRRLLQPLRQVALPLQAGAMPGASPELLALYLTSFQRWAQSTQQNWAVAFFDVKQAYYRTLRQLVVDCDSDDGLRRVLYELGLPEQATCELRDLLHRAADTSPLSGHEHLKAMLRDLLSATWFKFEASLLVAVTHKGTRPGDPAADVLFAFTLSALFRAIESSLASHDLVDPLPQVRQAPLVDACATAFQLQFVSWADDFARPFVGCSAEVLLEKVRRATKCCTERASSCGIELTFGAEKTAAVCDVGTVQALRETGLDVAADGVDFTDEVADRPCTLPFVHAYKHLGGIFCATSKPDLEIFLRRASALGPLRPVRGKLFANRLVPVATRRTLLFALGLSRFIYGAGSLHLDQRGHQRSWYSTYVGIWSHLVPLLPGGRPHSLQVLHVSKAPPPHLFLALQRAAVLTKLISRRFDAILHMLQLELETAQSKSWLSQIESDIHAVATWVQPARALCKGPWPLQELCRQVVKCPVWWTAVVRQAIRDYAADIVVWRSKPRTLAVSDGGAFVCRICHDTFVRRSCLTVHLARRHQLFAPARHFAPCRQCVSCLKTFATIMLAQAHLRKSPACIRRAAWLMEPLDYVDICAAEKFDKQLRKKIKGGCWQRQATVVRAQQGAGPHNITAMDVERDPEAFSIVVVARHFRPNLEVLHWLDTYLAEASRDGPRQRTSCWWLARPSSMN